jgi:hypothetical protein
MAMSWESVKPARTCERFRFRERVRSPAGTLAAPQDPCEAAGSAASGPGGLLVASHGCVMTEKTAPCQPTRQRHRQPPARFRGARGPATRSALRRQATPRPSITEGDQRRTLPPVEMATQRRLFARRHTAPRMANAARDIQIWRSSLVGQCPAAPDPCSIPRPAPPRPVDGSEGSQAEFDPGGLQLERAGGTTRNFVVRRVLVDSGWSEFPRPLTLWLAAVWSTTRVRGRRANRAWRTGR